jgi:hypothetical protein
VAVDLKVSGGDFSMTGRKPSRGLPHAGRPERTDCTGCRPRIPPESRRDARFSLGRATGHVPSTVKAPPEQAFAASITAVIFCEVRGLFWKRSEEVRVARSCRDRNFAQLRQRQIDDLTVRFPSGPLAVSLLDRFLDVRNRFIFGQDPRDAEEQSA